MMRVLTFLFVLLSVFSSPGLAQLPAKTGCIAGIDTAVTIFRPDIKDSFSLLQLEAHEAIHRRQIADGMKEGLDCFKAFWRLTESPSANLKSEAEAYQAQAKWLAAHAKNFDEAGFYEYMASRLYFAYESKLPYNYIHEALKLGTLPEQFTAKPVFPLPDPMAGMNPDGELWKSK